MKKEYILLIVFNVFLLIANSQQLPFYTQHNSNSFLLNPGSTGIKRLVDVRLNYRQQWTGYDGAPKTASLGINSRLAHGKMGAGFSLISDQIGPLKKLSLGGSYAVHILFPDCELSAGISGNAMKTTLQGQEITIRDNQDPAINQNISASELTGDAAFGVYLYNDRFHTGIGVLQPIESKTEFYKDDTLKKGIIKNAVHLNVSVGYNYSQNPDYIWQSSLYSAYVKGAPLILDYTLLLNYKERMFGGFSIRMGDAIALHVGVSFLDDFQVSYSYDFLISRLRNVSAGSHEITLVYSTNFTHSKHGRIDDRFLRQKYGYLF